VPASSCLVTWVPVAVSLSYEVPYRMSHRRSAIRDRLRRRELVVASPVLRTEGDEGQMGDDYTRDLQRMDSAPLIQPAQRHNSASGRASSLSPPRNRPRGAEGLSVVRLKTDLPSPMASPASGRERLRGILGIGSPREGAARLGQDVPVGTSAEGGGGQNPKASDELREWFRGARRGSTDEGIPGLRVLEDVSLGMDSGSVWSRETSEFGDVDSVETGSAFSDRVDDIPVTPTRSSPSTKMPWTPRTPPSTPRRRMMASQRPWHMKGFDDEEPEQWTGATSMEFVCVSIGLMLLLLVTYMLQHAVRSGYITPPAVTMLRHIDDL